jgi:N6-L-threonylcarbamoyladenine synthase
VAAVLADRAGHALAMLPAATALVIAGGVAANAAVRGALGAAAAERGLPLVAPPPRLCTDNAVMVAWAGAQRLRLGLADPLDHAPRPRWPLEEMAAAS